MAAKEKDAGTANELERERRELIARRDLKEWQWALLAELMNPPSAGESVRKRRQPRNDKSPRGPLVRAKTSRSPLVPAEGSDTILVILTALAAKAPPGYLPPDELLWETTRNPALVDQAEDQIGALEQLLEMQTPWVYSGCRADLPPCACYTGCIEVCHKQCAVWVMPQDAALLHRFTRNILTLAAPNALQETPARSPAFSPNLR